MMAYGIPACSSPPAHHLSLLSDYTDKTVLAATQWPWSGKGFGFAKCLLSLKKKNLKSFYLKLFSWRISQPFPPKQLYGQSHRAIVLQLTGRGMEWDAEITLTIIATRDRTLQSHSLTFCSEPQPYFLLLAWPRLKAGLWESYLPSLRLSISVSYSVK